MKHIKDVHGLLSSDVHAHADLDSADKKNLAGELAVVMSKKKGIELVLSSSQDAEKDLKSYKDSASQNV